MDLQKAQTLNAPQAISTMFGLPIEEAISIWRANSHDMVIGKEKPKDFLERLRKSVKSTKNNKELLNDWAVLNSKKREHINWELLDFIKKLQKQFKVYIFSDTFNVAMDDDLNKEINSMFDGIFVSYREGFRKPSPEAFQNVLNKIGANPEECIFIDDTERNIIAANELGVKAFLYRSLNELKDDLYHAGIT